MERIGFVGVGTMGRPMVRNLLRAGFLVTVTARQPDRVQDVFDAGAAFAATPAEVGRASDVVFVCVTSSPDVQAVVNGPGGILEGLASGGVIVDMSTIDPAVSQQVAAACADRGVAFLDAPVSGGETGAINGTLTIMVGGDAAMLERVRPMLNAMGNPENVVHCGPVGSGEVVKLVNNLLGGTIAAACGEALTLGLRAGADLATMQRVILASSGASWQLAGAFPSNVYSRRFQPGFFLDLMTKDVGLATALGAAIGHAMPIAERVQATYQEAQAAGFGRADYTAVVRPIEDRAGVQLLLPLA